MKNVSFILFACFLGVLSSCNDVEFLPTKGSIYGIVVDNNDIPLEGVEVIATFDLPESLSGSESFDRLPVRNTTASDGAYELDDVWDEVYLEIDHTGFQSSFQRVELTSGNQRPQVNFTLTGSPTVESIAFDADTLNKENFESLAITMVVEDLYNTFSDTPIAYCQVQDSAGRTVLILDADIDSQSQTRFVFEAILTSESLPVGTYHVIGEATDPDGNTHQLSSDESIEVL